MRLTEVPIQELDAVLEADSRDADVTARPHCSDSQVKAAFHDAHGVIIAFDQSASDSFASVDTCLDVTANAWRLCSGPLFLVGCKADKRLTGDAAFVSDVELQAYCTAAGFTHYRSVDAIQHTGGAPPHGI